MKIGILRKNKGSLTVEACIAFPVFLFFFIMLIFFIKIACINITLNNVVRETAKQIATSAYPIKFLNEAEDDLLLNGMEYDIPTFDEEVKTIQQTAKETNKKEVEDLFTTLISGEFKKDTLSGSFNDLFKAVTEKLKGDLIDSVRAYVAQNYGKAYYQFKTKLKYTAVKSLTEKFIEGSYVNKEKIIYEFVEFPQSESEVLSRKGDESYAQICRTIGYTPQKDDVVVCIKYSIVVPVPFLKNKPIEQRFIAVEKAWLKGSNGVYSQEQPANNKNEGPKESIEDNYKKKTDEKNTTVYITKTGSHYHLQGCRMLNSSKIPIKETEVGKYGKSTSGGKCKICFEGFKIEQVKRK